RPTILPSFTCSSRPHCWPQKQQCVRTTRSGAPTGVHPPGGTSWQCGPKRSTRLSSGAGSLATSRFLPQRARRERQQSAAARRTDVLIVTCRLELVVNVELCFDPLQIRHVERRRKRLAAAHAARRTAFHSSATVIVETQLGRPLKNVEELAE